MGFSVPDPVSFQVGVSWVDSISHVMLKCPPSLSCCGLRALWKTWSRGEALSLRGRERLTATLHKSYSKLSEKKNALPLTKPLPLCNKACLRPKLTFFPLSRFSTLLLLLLSWAQLKDSNGCFFWNFEHVRLTLNETAKGDDRWTQRQCAWQKDPLPIPLIVLSEASRSASSRVC